MIKLSLALLLVSAKLGSCIRCFQCRSDEQSDCGDPFKSSQIQSFECNNVALQKTFSCYKMSTYLPGGTITVRGCAPFTSDFIPEAMYHWRNWQGETAGTYWNNDSSLYFINYNRTWNGFDNTFSLCDDPFCNSSSSLRSSILMVVIGVVAYCLTQ